MDLWTRRINSSSDLLCSGSHGRDNTSLVRQYLLVTKHAAVFWTRCSFLNWFAGRE